MRTTIKKWFLASFLLSTIVLAAGSVNAALLYFPHVDTSLPWKTEIGIINTSHNQSVTGILRGLNNDGQLVETMSVTLSAHGRRQIIVASEFTNHINIGYIIFDTDSAAVQGYTKLYQAGIYRAATPAVKVVNTSDIYISHIDSSAQWWTGVTLVNTTSATKNMTITFNNGVIVPYTLNANQRRVFTIGSLLNQPLQPDIKSAVITNASGVIGLELFGSNTGIGGDQLDGILLTDKTASTIYYPHIDSNGWWTGIVAYNPAESAATITITPYSAQGTLLAPSTLPIAGKGKYVGVVAGLGLPAQTAWFRIDSTLPLSGFELFSTVNGNQLAAYAESGGTGSKAGIFAKIEKSGWTGIAFVNTEESMASVTLMAFNDNGTAVATQVLPVDSHAKVVNYADAVFSPQDISGATYIAYSSDRNVVGFQLNGTSDGMMLDALPGLDGEGNIGGTVLPATATLISPSGTISTTTPTYTWNAVSNASYYYFRDGTLGTALTVYSASEAGCSSGTGTCSVTRSTLAPGSYFWYIQTWNSYGFGPWSSGMAYTISTGGGDGFNEQFTSNPANWSQDSGRWSWESGDYWYTDGLPNFPRLGFDSQSTYIQTYTNFDYSARLRRTGPSYSNRLWVRASESIGSNGWSLNGYAFQYTNDGKFSVWKNVNGVDTRLVDWRDTSAINTGTAWNTLRVSASGSNFYFYINGTLVANVTDSSFSSGRVGVGMYRNYILSTLWVDWATLTIPAMAVEPTDEQLSEAQLLLNQHPAGGRSADGLPDQSLSN